MPPNLLAKWTEELEEFAKQVEVLEPYLSPKERVASAHIRQALPAPHTITVQPGDQSLDKGGQGIFMVSKTRLAQLVGEQAGAAPSAQRRFLDLTWNLVIADEAHHYAKENKGGRAVRALCEKQRKANAKILLCTATPFQLDTNELVALIGLIESKQKTRDEIEQAISDYNQSIVDIQQMPVPSQDTDLKTRLRPLLDDTKQKKTYLQNYLRQYLLRSRRDDRDREYRDRSIDAGKVFPWTYWRVKDWIRELARGDDRVSPMRTFVPTTLHMTLSSPQALEEHLQKQLDKSLTNKSAAICHEILTATAHGEHPKFKALGDFISRQIEEAAGHFAGQVSDLADYKCVIFVHHPATIQSVIEQAGSTAKLVEQLDQSIRRRTDDALNNADIPPADYRKEAGKALGTAIKSLLEMDFAEPDKPNIWNTPYEAPTENEAWHLRLVGFAAREDLSQVMAKDSVKSIRKIFTKNLRAKLTEPLHEYRLALQVIKEGGNWKQSLQICVERAVRERAGEILKSVRKLYYGSGDQPTQPREWLRLRLSRVAYGLYPRHAIEEIFGGKDFSARQQIINAFNKDLYPLVLICSSVGEEGIDLQKQCNTVVHYDLEWNPAKVEQREGRVDRVARDRTKAVQVVTFKLADTYDERILARCNNRKIWMELYLCRAWREEGKQAEIEGGEKHSSLGDIPTWLQGSLEDLRLDLRPEPI